MSTLRGSERSPVPVESPVHHKDINEGAKREEREAYDKRLKVYEEYLETPEGQAALALVDLERKRIDYEMMLSPRELGMTVEEAGYHKAMLAGERRVWTRLVTEPDMIKACLDKLEGKEEQDTEKKPGWAKMPKELLDKFRGDRVISQSTNAASTA